MTEREREGALDNKTRAELKHAYETGSTYSLKNLLIHAIRRGASREEVLTYLRELGMAPGNVKDLRRDIEDALRPPSIPVARPNRQYEPSLPTWAGLAIALVLVLIAIGALLVGFWYITTML